MIHKCNDHNEEIERDSEQEDRSFFSRFVQPVGALIVTAIAMW